jgi:hypothetical protein
MVTTLAPSLPIHVWIRRMAPVLPHYVRSFM